MSLCLRIDKNFFDIETLQFSNSLFCNIPITDAAEALGVNRNTIADLIKGRSRVSTPMALRLAKAFGTTAELWLNMQQNYDLWMARKKVSLSNVKVLFSAEPSFSH